jgi:hypothetical protein
LIIAIGVHISGTPICLAAARVSGIFSGAALVVRYRLQQIATLAEETEHARNVVPRALLPSIAVTTALRPRRHRGGWRPRCRSLAHRTPLARIASDVLGWRRGYARRDRPLLNV